MRAGGDGSRSGGQGCGCGCASVLVVLTVGLLLSLFNSALGIGVTVRVPFTDSSVTLAGSVGKKEKAVESLPGYVAGHLAGNQNLVNSTTTLTLGPAEGTTLFLIGRQPGAPVLDLHLAAQ